MPFFLVSFSKVGQARACGGASGAPEVTCGGGSRGEAAKPARRGGGLRRARHHVRRHDVLPELRQRPQTEYPEGGGGGGASISVSRRSRVQVQGGGRPVARFSPTASPTLYCFQHSIKTQNTIGNFWQNSFLISIPIFYIMHE